MYLTIGLVSHYKYLHDALRTRCGEWVDEFDLRMKLTQDLQ